MMRLFDMDELPELVDAAKWVAADHPELRPLECKALYSACLVRNLIESAGLCFDNGYHLGAYQLGASSMEPLGVIAVGNHEHASERMARGVLFGTGGTGGEPRDTEVFVTAAGQYTVHACIERRGFTAHGGRWLAGGVALDAELTARMLQTALDDSTDGGPPCRGPRRSNCSRRPSSCP